MSKKRKQLMAEKKKGKKRKGRVKTLPNPPRDKMVKFAPSAKGRTTP